jgi:hypothetical protein
MIKKIISIQKKNHIGKSKADKIYERFMNYDNLKKKNQLNNKIDHIDKENVASSHK